MGLDFEILENEYNKIAADKAEVEARTDLTDEEKQTTLAGFDRALEGLEGGIVTLATKTKQDMQAIIADLEKKILNGKILNEKEKLEEYVLTNYKKSS